jgi:Tfp pilus assembly protein PilN
MRAVNLLPQQAIGEQPRLPKALPLVGAAAVPVIALLLLIVGYAGGHSAVATNRTQLEALRAQIAASASVPAAATPVVNTSAIVTSRMARRAALEDVLGKQVAWDTTLRDVARVLPATVWLTSLTATSPISAESSTAPAPVPAGTPATGFAISGDTYSENDVALLLQRLQLLPTLTGVTLGSTSQTSIGARVLIQFTISAALQPPQPKAQP